MGVRVPASAFLRHKPGIEDSNMPPNKTQPTDVDVGSFLASVKTERPRNDANAVLKLMREVSGEPGRIWGASIVGFGLRRYSLAGEKSGEICNIGFSPRASAKVRYL